MHRSNRGLVAIGAAIVLSLGLMSPIAAATATATPSATSATTTSAGTTTS